MRGRLSTLTWRTVTNVTRSCRGSAAGGARRPSSTSLAGCGPGVRSSTCTPSTPGDLERMAATRAPSTSHRHRRSSPQRCWAGRYAPSSRRCRRAKLGWGWAKFAFGSWTTLSWVDAEHLASRRAEGLVLQRHGDRGQAVVEFDLDAVAYLRSDGGSAGTARRRRLRVDRRHPGRRHRLDTKAIR